MQAEYLKSWLVEARKAAKEETAGGEETTKGNIRGGEGGTYGVYGAYKGLQLGEGG